MWHPGLDCEFGRRNVRRSDYEIALGRDRRRRGQRGCWQQWRTGRTAATSPTLPGLSRLAGLGGRLRRFGWWGGRLRAHSVAKKNERREQRRTSEQRLCLHELTSRYRPDVSGNRDRLERRTLAHRMRALGQSGPIRRGWAGAWPMCQECLRPVGQVGQLPDPRQQPVELAFAAETDEYGGHRVSFRADVQVRRTLRTDERFRIRRRASPDGFRGGGEWQSLLARRYRVERSCEGLVQRPSRSHSWMR